MFGYYEHLKSCRELSLKFRCAIKFRAKHFYLQQINIKFIEVSKSQRTCLEIETGVHVSTLCFTVVYSDISASFFVYSILTEQKRYSTVFILLFFPVPTTHHQS